MRICTLLAVAALAVSCSTKTIEANEWNRLNGYWEIESVTNAQGQDIDYKGNTVYDYIEVKDSVGKRFKVKPQLDGSFITHNNVEEFVIRVTDTGTTLLYRTDFNNWNELLLTLDDEQFEVENAQGIRYLYRKTGPIKSPFNETQK